MVKLKIQADHIRTKSSLNLETKVKAKLTKEGKQIPVAILVSSWRTVFLSWWFWFSSWAEWLKAFESSLLIEEIASSGFNGVVVGDSVVTVSPPSASGTLTWGGGAGTKSLPSSVRMTWSTYKSFMIFHGLIAFQRNTWRRWAADKPAPSELTEAVLFLALPVGFTSPRDSSFWTNTL